MPAAAALPACAFRYRCKQRPHLLSALLGGGLQGSGGACRKRRRRHRGDACTCGGAVRQDSVRQLGELTRLAESLPYHMWAPDSLFKKETLSKNLL